MKNWHWTVGVAGLGAVLLLFFGRPLVALVGRGWAGLTGVGWTAVWPALRLSLQTTAVVILLAFVMGTPLAYAGAVAVSGQMVALSASGNAHCDAACGGGAGFVGRFRP
ncbi:MAG: hypothetical protein IPL28_24430 [Chloroflexi bacterium]|nr:hypothetical protein [Chloroflexota bacterium]